MASGSGASLEELCRAGSSSNQQPNQSPTQTKHEPEEEEDPEKIIFANMKLFEATIARLQKAKIAGTWAPPKMEAALTYNLKAENPAPEFIPMSLYVDMDWQPQRPGTVAVPSVYLRLAKATELIFHHLPVHEIRDCLPKDIRGPGTRSHKTMFFEKKLKAHVSSTTRGTLERGFFLACSILEQAMKSEAFYDTMRQKSEVKRILAIDKLIEPKHIFYLYNSQFKVVSFPFIFHEAKRHIAEEEVLRNDLQKLLRYSTAQMIYDYLWYCIKAEEGKEESPIEKGGAGKAAVRTNYLAVPYHGPAKDIYKSLRRLPALPDF